MTMKIKLIIVTALVALLAVPASARIAGDEGGSSAYPFRDNQGRGVWHGDYRAPTGILVNRPSQSK